MTRRPAVALAAPERAAAMPHRGVQVRWDRVAPLALWIAMVAFVACRHEPWFDEAQPWLLARSSRVLDLLVHHLRYEGSPGLWHLLLVPLAKLSFPYASIQVLAAAAASAAVVLILWSDLPLALRVLLPFTYFLAYQYAVVARSYALLAVLALLAARLHESRARRPVAYVAVLCLLANVSLHGTLIAGGLVLAHVLRLRRIDPRNAKALVLFAVTSALIVLQLWPPADGAFVIARGTAPGQISMRAWRALDGAFCDEQLLTCGVVVVSALFFRSRGVLLEWLLPTVALLAFFGFVYVNVWHHGALFVVWLHALVVAFARAPRRAEPPWAPWVVTTMFAALALVQIGWTVDTAANDVRVPVSSSRTAAAFLREHRLEDRIFAVGFGPYGVLPFFDHNIFVNRPGSRDQVYFPWTWSTFDAMTEAALAEAKPEWVLVGSHPYDFAFVPEGYELEYIFLGRIYWKRGGFEDDRLWLYRRVTQPSAARPGTPR